MDSINKWLQTFLLGLLFNTICIGQKLKDPDDFLVPKSKDSLPEIYLVGTIHFEYYNKDAYKISEDRQMNILSSQKQKELNQLLDYISLFKPNKILIEGKSARGQMDRYRQYKLKKIPIAKDEIMQIAFRLMDRFNLDTIYSIDAGSIADDLTLTKDSLIIGPYIDSIFKDYAFRSNANYTRFYEYQTQLSTEISLLDLFKYINSQKVLEASYGAYLTGDFKLGDFRGADALAMYWYDRNLRIFRNIQRVTGSPNDRILVLFGAGHIEILDQLLRSSSEYNYIRFNDLGK